VAVCVAFGDFARVTIFVAAHVGTGARRLARDTSIRSSLDCSGEAALLSVAVPSVGTIEIACAERDLPAVHLGSRVRGATITRAGSASLQEQQDCQRGGPPN